MCIVACVEKRHRNRLACCPSSLRWPFCCCEENISNRCYYNFDATKRPLYIFTPCCSYCYSLRLPEKPSLSVCVQVGNLFTTPAYCAKQALFCCVAALRTILREDHPKNYFYSSCNTSSNSMHHYTTYLDLIILRRQMFKQTTVKISNKPRSV